MNKLLQLLAIVGIYVAAFLFRMFVLVKIWSYVAVPMGANPITTVQAYGIYVIITLVAAQEESLIVKGDTTQNLANLTGHFLQTLTSWAVAYLVFG